MNEELARQVFERLAKIEGQMSQFLIAAANGLENNERLTARVTSIELALAQFRGQTNTIGRVFDIALSVVMAGVGALAYKYLGV